MNLKDSIVYTDENLSLFDEEEGEVEFHMVARVTLDGHQYAIFEDPEDEEGLLVFNAEMDEDDNETFNPVMDEDESERVFYLYEAAFDDYEFGQAK
ncbi:MAG: DUF1292 domain-containing protein [Clostridiales bacterium]|nr:DUF1292 domain-containing protein [Clostridiales bacterium]